ncbi:MAG: dienelactone hydrolase [Pseudomonadota bacterium]
MKRIGVVIVMMTTFAGAAAQENRIDVVRPDAPELSAFGRFDIGVRTMRFTDAGRVDVVNTKPGEQAPLYDRRLNVEIWYPAELGDRGTPGGEYTTETRNLQITATLRGQAVRDAAPLALQGNFPLVILSHGYPGNRYLMSHLGENLASKGYVVASIDHTDSTYQNQQPIASTLYNRAKDQRFVLQAIADYAAEFGSFLSGLVNVNNTAIIGFSMGGYGMLNNLGAPYSESMIEAQIAPPNRLLSELTAANPDYRKNLDPRIRAGVAIAPWGMNTGFFDAEVLQGITLPTLYVAGSVDGTAGYEEGTRAIFESAVNSDRLLLTFANGGHSVAAPIPLPVEILNSEDQAGAGHYTDAVWDSVRSNNILQHFVTAFLDVHLKEDQGKEAYLDLIPDPAAGIYSIRDGQPTSEHNYWKGFALGTAVGLTLEHRGPGE